MKKFKIADREIGGDAPAYVIAEVSCNHEGDIKEARRIIEAAARAGADAVKIQTYTPETMTRDFKSKPEGTIWENTDLYSLYAKAHTPWEWSFELKELAENLGMHLFSSPFDETAVDFLVDELKVSVLKVASFEVADTKLLEKMAKTGLPIIMSNGMTDYLEMAEAVEILRKNGCSDLALLHCNSGYPAAFAEANLKTMQAMEGLFDTVVGVSDHTLFMDHKNCEQPMAHITPVEAVRMGAKVIEVHLMMDREHGRQLFEKDEGGYDWPFSMEPDELKKMVDMIREFERTGNVFYSDEEEAIAGLVRGQVTFEPTEKEKNSRKLRPSLWCVKDVKKGDALKFAAEDKEHGNFDSIRPGGGLHVRFTDFIEGQKASRDIKAGEPLDWDMVGV
ncbi:MAG: pseudaminic acid synthase [Micavibrio sp.]|nr:pseudaminic acid synthase [Micavibrio sp.]